MTSNERSIVDLKMDLRRLRPARRKRVLAAAKTGTWEGFLAVLGEELLGGLADTGVRVDHTFFTRREADEMGLAQLRKRSDGLR